MFPKKQRLSKQEETMKKLFIVLFILVFASEAFAFMPSGNINRQFSYEDFRKDGDNFTFTLVNESNQGLAEFYVIIKGFDLFNKQIYYHKFYVEFIAGDGEITETIPGHDARISRIEVTIKKNEEVDTRSVD